VELQEQALALLAEQGVAEADRSTDRLVECRYVGQEHSIAVTAYPGATAETIAETIQPITCRALRPRAFRDGASFDIAGQGDGSVGEATAQAPGGGRGESAGATIDA